MLLIEKTVMMPQYPNKKSILFLFLALLCLQAPLWSQSLTKRNWYFGNGTKAIRFDRPSFKPQEVNRPAITYGNAGGAVATDGVTGNLLFYTDGNLIYNLSHVAMPGGTLGGDNSKNQPVVICPDPDPTKPTAYYVFVLSSTGILRQAKVKTDDFGSEAFPSPPLGNIVAGSISATTLANRSEAMIVIPNSNGTDFWLITQNVGTDQYNVSSITAAGITLGTDIAATGSNGVPFTANHFAYHQATGQIAVAPKDINKNVTLLTFDNTLGTLTFNKVLPGTGMATATTNAVYDVEWSTTAKYLYISRTDIPDVVQVEVNPVGPAVSPISILPLTLGLTKSFGLQMGLDSAIYHIYQKGGNFLVAKISDTDSIASKVIYTPIAFDNNNFNTKQFPSFSPPAKLTVTLDFNTVGSCANSPISFYPIVTPIADSLVWDFGDGSATVNAWSPVHVFTSTSSTVTVKAYVNGEVVATTTKPLSLTDFKLQLSMKSDTTACSCELKYPKAINPPPPCGVFTMTAQSQGGTSPTYQWYGPSGELTGQTSTSLAIDSAGYYYIKGTDGGCSVTAGVNIKEYHVQDQRSNIWYFGGNSGIDFNPMFYTPPAPIKAISGPVNSPAGTAIICDQNGQVVLSTDGVQVYDRIGTPLLTVIPPGAGGNNTSTQSSIIIPVQSDQTLFYIFTTQAVESGTFEVNYVLFDLKLGTIGGIVDPDNTAATSPASLLFTKSTERLTGNNNWLIAHEYGNNSFRAYKIDNAGISAPVISAIGSDHSITSLETARGYMKLGGANRLAVALNDGASNSIELFDFIDSSGVVTNFRKIDLNEASGQVYGVEFSGTKLYATIHNGSSSFIYEYNIDSLGVPKQLQKTLVTGDWGDLQTAPDGQIYIAVNGSTSLLHFSPVGDPKQPTPFTGLQTFALTGTSTLGLPNFIQQIGSAPQQPGMSVVGNCLGDSTSFSATPSDQYRDEYTWVVRQATTLITSSKLQNFTHIFKAAGTYQVTLDITSKCSYPNQLVARFTKTIVINAPPADPTFLIPPDNSVVLCSPTKKLEATPANTPGIANLGYVWSTTETTRVITISQPGTYDVTITDNVTGCSSNGSIDIFNNRPIVDLGPDFPMCSTDPTRILDAQNPASGNTYQWKINGANAGIAQRQKINSSTAGVFKYKVTVTDGSSGCSVADSVNVTVNATPKFTSTIITQPTCGLSNGSVRVDISTAGSHTVDFATQPERTSQSVGAVLPAYAGLAGGSYNVSVINELTGCIASDIVGLSNIGFQVSAPIVPATCDPVKVSITVTGGGGGINYIVTNTVTGVATISKPAGASPFLTDALAPGSYILEATDATNCKATTPITVPPGAPVDFTLDADCDKVNVALVNAPGAATYTWTGPVVNVNSPSTDVTGSGTVSVTVGDSSPGGLCSATQSIDVVHETITPSITASDLCQDEITLSAKPTPKPPAGYTYQWTTPTAANIPGEKIKITENGDYTVNVKSTTSGCDATSAPFNVAIKGKVSVSISSTVACTGQEFLVSAETTPDDATIQWFVDGTPIVSTDNPLPATKPGKYKVTASANGCPGVSDEINIGVLPVDKGTLPTILFICDDPDNHDPATNQVTLDPGSNFDSYDWFKDGTSLNVKTPTLVADAAAVYTVDLLNAFGCVDRDTTDVQRECDPKVVGPNAFRPGGLNTDFFLYTFFIDDSDFQIFIFNRWGEMVYQSSDRYFKWNGSFKGSGAALPPGTYSWVAKYKSSYRPEDGIKEKHGGVVLMR